jgi:hypothetical protein
MKKEEQRFIVKLLAETIEIEKDPSGADEHVRGRCLRVVSYETLVAEVQKRGSFMQ